MPEIEDLRSFVEVVESGGFNRAAHRLGVSKSIVSRRIGRLEADLGTRLIDRTTRGISPTEAGQEFKRRSEQILADLDAAREAMAERTGEAVGRLRISAPASFGVKFLSPVLGRLALQYPRLELDVSFNDRAADLIGEGFDAAIRIGTMTDSSLVARRIGTMRLVLVASPDYLARRGRPATPDDLRGHECLIYATRSAVEWQFQVGKKWVSVRPEGRLRADTGETTVQWAMAGLGIAELPSYLAEDGIADGRLEQLLPGYGTREQGIHVVRPAGTHVPGKVRVLIDTLAEAFAQPR